MAANSNRVSMVTTGSGDGDGKGAEPKKNLWTSMLESVASGKRLPEKNLLVLGMYSSKRYGLVEKWLIKHQVARRKHNEILWSHCRAQSRGAIWISIRHRRSRTALHLATPTTTSWTPTKTVSAAKLCLRLEDDR